jgi:hypothetical protein
VVLEGGVCRVANITYQHASRESCGNRRFNFGHEMLLLEPTLEPRAI